MDPVGNTMYEDGGFALLTLKNTLPHERDGEIVGESHRYLNFEH